MKTLYSNIYGQNFTVFSQYFPGGGSRLKIGLRQGFVTQVLTFSIFFPYYTHVGCHKKLKILDWDCYNFLKICVERNFCFWFKSALYNVLSILIAKLDLPLNLTRRQKTNENIVLEIQYFTNYYTNSLLTDGSQLLFLQSSLKRLF